MEDAIPQKQITVDFLMKTSKPNEGEAPQYYVENGHPGIVSKAVWQEVQVKWTDAGRRNCTFSPFANKIVCGDYGGLYGRKHGIPQPTGTLSGSAITRRPGIPSAIAVTFMPRNWIPQSTTLCSTCCRRTNTLLLTVRIYWSKHSESFR